MFSIRNNTRLPIVVRLEDFEGVPSEEIALALQPSQSGDLGDIDSSVTIVIEEG